jgi:hypothetical protein
MTTSIAVNLNTTDDQSFAASGTSNLATSGGPVSLTLNSDRKDDNLYHAWYNRNLTSSTVTVSGNITWGYDSKAHFESGSNANLTVYSGYSSHNEYFTGDRSQTLIANSAWSQVNGGVPFGTSFGSLVTVRNYRGGTSEIWNGYGGFASTYCGTESQSWNDPSIASYEARNLTGTRFTPHDPPGVPAPQLFSKTSKTFVMPPSLVEDAEAAAVEKGEESAIGRFLWSLVPGSSLVDAYRDYQKGDYVSAGLNGVSGLSDLLSLGTITKAKSSLKFFVGVMKVRIKDSVVDAVANEAGNAVAERYGPEAGFVTQIVVSGAMSRNVSQQNKKLNQQSNRNLLDFADGFSSSSRSNFNSNKAVKKGGRITEPNLPPKTIAQQDDVALIHYYRSGDHGPPHLHVIGGGPETRIGQAGKPIDGSPKLTAM